MTAEPDFTPIKYPMIPRMRPTFDSLPSLSRSFLLGLALLSGLATPTAASEVTGRKSSPPSDLDTVREQVPSWSQADLDFFLHGSMSTEVIPESVLRAFIRVYPELFPTGDFQHLGLIPDPAFGWPIGFSRSRVDHLGGLSSVGINCAACHVGNVEAQGKSVRVLGMTSHFDAEGFFGALLAATFKSAEPNAMRKFLAAYLAENDASGGSETATRFASEWQKQEPLIKAVLQADPFGAKGIPPGSLHSLKPEDLQIDAHRLEHGQNLADLTQAMVRLFHNIRAALHVPDEVPAKAPPASGPGRNDAFGLLSLVFFGAPQPYAPVKYGLVWNLSERPWVHWDGNTRSPLGRNLLAALGLGAPMIGNRGDLDFALIQQQTELTEKIRAPRYPFSMDSAAALRGAEHFKKACASCHTGPEGDSRLYDCKELGTDVNRAVSFDPSSAERFNGLLARLETPGYAPVTQPGIRSTQKYWAPTLSGVWARSPYLHNGSVRTLRELLDKPATRAKSFQRGTRVFDEEAMGYQDAGHYVLDTATSGNSHSGHDYGTDLPFSAKRDLIEYLKTL